MWLEQALEDSTIVRGFRELPIRQRQASLVILTVVMLAVIYVGIWRPIFDYRENAVERMTTTRQMLDW
nr:type II secretion system protein M [Pseudomonadales bacterium]